MTALEPVDVGSADAQFVDPPERPIDLPTLASHVHEKPAIFPPLIRSRDEFRALVIWLVRYGAHATGFHVTRSSIYAARFLSRRPGADV